jgi:PIN domain nuclease of toxin-antitoxin system
VKLLLDTHAFLWWLSSPGELSQPAAAAIADRANEVQVSVISLWEIAIKWAIGKLHAPVDLASDVTDAGFQLLPLTVEHIIATERLPLHHRDPLDRMLIAQAQLEGAALVTRDPQFPPYNLRLIRA